MGPLFSHYLRDIPLWQCQIYCEILTKSDIDYRSFVNSVNYGESTSNFT